MKQKSPRDSQPIPNPVRPYKLHVTLVLIGLVLGACLIIGTLYLRRPKSSTPEPSVPASKGQAATETEDPLSQLFGPAASVPEVKAEALRLANHMIERFPQNSATLFLMGSVYGQLGEVEKNVTLWKEVIRLNPQHADIYGKLAQLFKDQGNVDQAVVYWQQGLKIDPNNDESLWALANTHIETNHADQAVDLLKRACALAPQSVRNYYLLGQAYRQLRQYEKALPQYEKAIALDPNHFNAHYDLALTYRNLDQPERAKATLMKFQSLRKAIKKAIPEDIASDDLPENLKRLARYYWQAYTIYRTDQQDTQGLALLKRAMALDPFNTYFHELLAVYHTQHKEYAQALTVYQHTQAIDPNQPLFAVNIGQLYAQMGQPAQAERVYIKTIKDFPEYALGYVELTRLYLSAQRSLARTMGLAQRAVDLQPSAGNYHLLSWTYLVNKQYPQALRAIERALVLDPNNKNYQMHYEQIKSKQ